MKEWYLLGTIDIIAAKGCDGGAVDCGRNIESAEDGEFNVSRGKANLIWVLLTSNERRFRGEQYKMIIL